ncbi:MAG: hypothetical protein OJF55_001490 [Rhodanobacteraceae bacterium]|nr:MAG: hypothetical protein OJF55_001490 [Rhodanobacteraceae bacterium]
MYAQRRGGAGGWHDECHAIFRYHMHMRAAQGIGRMATADLPSMPSVRGSVVGSARGRPARADGRVSILTP